MEVKLSFELRVRRLGQRDVPPQVWGQVGVGLRDGSVRGLGEVTQGTGGASG